MIAQISIGLRIAVPVGAGVGTLIPFGERRQDRLPDRRANLDASGLERPGQRLVELLPIGEGRAREPRAQSFLDRRLHVRVQLQEGLLRLQAFDTLRYRLEVQPQGPLDADLPVSEVGGVEGLGEFPALAVAVQHVGIDTDDLLARHLGDFPALGA